MGKQSQLLLKLTKVELGLQVGVEFDKNLGFFQKLTVTELGETIWTKGPHD